MKKTTILNAALSQTIATLGHTESLVVCDAGLPIPDFSNRIDLALTKGIPSFLDTLYSVSSEMFIEKAILAIEIKDKNPQILNAILAHLSQLEKSQNNKIPVEYITHEEFKKLTHNSKGIVRTGECSPYANVILISGVPF